MTRLYTEAEADAHQARMGKPSVATPKPDPRVAPQMTLLELRILKFALPFPPSVNDAWHHVPYFDETDKKLKVRTTLTDDHRYFRTNVIARVRMSHRDAPLAGRIELRLALFYANRRRTDIDNRLKPLLDALTHARAFNDDSQVDRLWVERILTEGEERCEVVLQEIAS